MASGVPALSLLDLPECVYEHIIEMSGDWPARYRTMAKLELAANAFRIDDKMWDRMVLKQLKEIKDVDWERLLFLYPTFRDSYKEQASRCNGKRANLVELWYLFKAIALDNVDLFVEVLRAHPEALTQIVWDATLENDGGDDYVDGRIIAYMYEMVPDGVPVDYPVRPQYVQPRQYWDDYWSDEDQMDDEAKEIVDWEFVHCGRLGRPLDNEENRALCIKTYNGLVERKMDICTFVKKLAGLKKRKRMDKTALKIAAHLYNAAALK